MSQPLLQSAAHGAERVTQTMNPVLMSVCLRRMKEGQKDIFYMAADSLDAASSAPFVERLVQRDFEVTQSANFFFHLHLLGLSCHCFWAHVESALAAPCSSHIERFTAQQPCCAITLESSQKAV